MAVAGVRGKSLERDVVWKQTRGILTLNTHFDILDVGKAAACSRLVGDRSLKRNWTPGSDLSVDAASHRAWKQGMQWSGGDRSGTIADSYSSVTVGHLTELPRYQLTDDMKET
ncbi:MAG: hypothetical protein CL912_31440 [Deltaproteobacteria bacterium]|nr:hypothetical protein [Deltaproteobacteria bacterium]|tara:strand:- start:103 stop:441 length:339 start_codon:yes stop_codon:yes gene_type:complete